jgi:hypothetical protein
MYADTAPIPVKQRDFYEVYGHGYGQGGVLMYDTLYIPINKGEYYKFVNSSSCSNTITANFIPLYSEV